MLDDFFAEVSLADSSARRYRELLTDFLSTYPQTDKLTSGQLKAYCTRPQWASTSTQYRALAICKKYLTWLHGPGHPALKARIRRIDPPPGRSLNTDQIAAIAATFNTRTPKGRRDLAIYCLFLESALRVSEMCTLELRHVHPSKGTLQALVKGRKWRAAWFSQYTASTINAWLADRASIARPDCKTLFCSVGGETPGAPLTRFGLGHEVAKWGAACGIKLSPHDLRRTFGNETARKGANERVAMLAGGWKSPAAYKRYTLSLTPADIEPYSPIINALTPPDETA